MRMRKKRLIILYTIFFARDISFIGTYASKNNMSETIKDKHWGLLKHTIEKKILKTN